MHKRKKKLLPRLKLSVLPLYLGKKSNVKCDKINKVKCQHSDKGLYKYTVYLPRYSETDAIARNTGWSVRNTGGQGGEF